MEFKPTIGLEIHAELLTKTKIFCSCKNAFGGEPNTRICPVCAGFPGILPVLNKEAVILAVKAGLALGCEIQNLSAFDRKNYFYPDLPKSYQITQQFMPICKNGAVEIGSKKIRINNIHLEEDAGKLIHENDVTLIDYNRCGVPLIEIVTQPDFSSPEEVVSFVEELCARLKYAGVCDVKMEQGSLRVDVNVSVAEENSEKPGIRTETKNLGSLKAVRNAIKYEINRQTEILQNGGTVLCETRRFDEALAETLPLREKESEQDYRYFPEPDIPPVYVSNEEIEIIRNDLPVMPGVRFQRYVRELGLTEEEAKILVSDREFSDYFDCVCASTGYFKKAASLMLVGMNRLFNKYGGNLAELKISPDETAKVSKLWGEGKISSGNAMELLEILFLNGGSAEETAVSNNMLITFDPDAARAVVCDIITQNPDAVLDYKKGSKKVLGYFIGLAMSRLGKNADPAGVRNIVENCLRKEI